MVTRVFLCVFALTLARAAKASYECTGTLDFVSVSPSGVVTVGSASSGLQVFYVCQLGTTMYGVGPDQCTGLLATLLAAETSGATVTWAFNDSLTCNRASLNGGNWYWLNEAPSSWYYGPQVNHTQ